MDSSYQALSDSHSDVHELLGMSQSKSNQTSWNGPEQAHRKLDNSTFVAFQNSHIYNIKDYATSQWAATAYCFTVIKFKEYWQRELDHTGQQPPMCSVYQAYDALRLSRCLSIHSAVLQPLLTATMKWPMTVLIPQIPHRHLSANA